MKVVDNLVLVVVLIVLMIVFVCWGVWSDNKKRERADEDAKKEYEKEKGDV